MVTAAMRPRRTRVRRAATLAGVVWFVASGALHGAGQFIEDIQVSRRGDEATVTIELACPMRFRSDGVTPAGVLLEIRVTPLDGCRQLGVGTGITTELYRPVSGHLAHLVEVAYESLGLGDNLLLLKFDRPVDYRVAQRGDLRTLELRVRLDAEVSAVPIVPEAEPLAAAPQAVPPAAAPSPAPSGRAPLTVRVRAPVVLADYMINLQSTREPVAPSIVASVPVPAGQQLYVSTTTVAGITWFRLRLGFFAAESEATNALVPLAAAFPRAWIGRAEAEVVLAAAERAVEPGGVVAVEAEREAILAPSVAGGALSAERIAELLAAGRAALVAGDFDTAIRAYARLLEEPGEHRAEARENLGLAREKNGEPARRRASGCAQPTRAWTGGRLPRASRSTTAAISVASTRISRRC
jgi:hypothetical protein